MRNEIVDAQTDFEYKERFELLAQATHDVVWDWNLETNLIWWNDSFKSQFGYQDKDIEPGVESWYNRIHPDDRQRVIDGIHQVIDFGGKNWSDEYRFLKADGTYADIFDRGYTLHKNGKAHRMLGSMMDITATKKVAGALRRSEDRLRVAVESTELGTWDFNPSTGVLEWSDRCKELFGVPPEAEITYDVFLEGLHPEDKEPTDKVVQNTLRGKNDGYFDIEYRTIGIKDRKHRWISAKGRAYFNSRGNAERFIGTVLDITEQKRNEQELRASEERFRTLFDNASVGMAIVDLNGRFLQANPVFTNMIGYTEEEIKKTDFAAITHPADIDQNVEDIRKTILGEIPGFKIEKRYLRKSGEVFWGEVWVSLIKGIDGKPKSLIAIVLDITKQRLAKEALEKSAETYRFVLDAMPQKVWTANAQGEVDYFNKLWVNYTGHSIENLLGTGWHKVIHPDDGAVTLRLWTESLQTGNRLQMEHRILNANGEYRWHLSRAEAQRGEDGNILLWVGTSTDIDDQKRTEESLKLQARVLESMDEGVSVSDQNGFILYTNTAEDKMFGYEHGELIGKHVTVQNAYPAEENERIVNEVIDQLKAKGYWTGEWANIKKDGTHFTTFSHITALDVGDKKLMVCVQRDVTEEKSNKEELEYRNKLIKTIADNTTSALLMMDKTGHCTFMNPAAEKMFGYRFEEISAKPLHYMIHHHRPDGSFYPKEECPIDRVLPDNFDIRAHKDVFFRKDGTSFPVSCAASPIFENGVPVATVIEIRDITQELNAENALKKSAEELEARVQERTIELREANNRLEKSNNELEQFAYVASHDLQEPLRKIQIFGDRLQNQAYEQLSDEGKSWLDKILGSAQRMSSLIKDLLDYSRLSPSRVENKFSKVGLNEVVENILNDLELVINQKNALIKVSDLPVIEAVELQMNQLFYNLIANSLKFVAKDRQPIISIATEKISERDYLIHHLQESKEYIKLVFADNGIGFKQEFAEQIFVIFQRLNTRDKYPGTGIGLALCRRVVDNHHGVIYAEAREGEGASFVIILPVVQ